MSGNGGQGTVLVIGGGISGITAAIEASEAGCDVIVVEKNA
ncbi:FAD-dependent oxidoreductase, partial [Gemmatimonadota bacterium]